MGRYSVEIDKTVDGDPMPTRLDGQRQQEGTVGGQQIYCRLILEEKEPPISSWGWPIGLGEWFSEGETNWEACQICECLFFRLVVVTPRGSVKKGWPMEKDRHQEDSRRG